MRRKSLIAVGVVLALISLQSCKSNPEQSLLKSYFHAVSLNDVSTMSTMAVDPLKIEAASWTITKAGETKIEPASLAELAKAEVDLKKQQDVHVPVTLDAKDALDVAKDEYNSARTAAAKAAAKAKMDAAQTKYDDEYKIHQDIIRKYGEAKAATAREEEITTFSLGAGQLPNVRDLKGEVNSKEVEVQIKEKGGAVKNFKITIRMYNLKDEAANISHRGRWIITKFEQI
ncbi:MAG: hypothetical protein Q8O91_09045 [Candidatus Aminicenantes bacterium]|nr:hypothetical protein [Candidatus Aminicenantes bacterium]